MNNTIHYFAYGSNMSTRRLAARISGVRPVGSGELYGHELRFHKRGRDGSGKCDAFQVDRDDARVIGVLFTLPREGKLELDRIEGLGQGYEQKIVSVVTPQGSSTRALTYYATHFTDRPLPYCWYRHHVLTGAREFGLPADYIQTVASVPYAQDRDPARRRREMSIY